MNVSIWDRKKQKFIRVINIKLIFQSVNNDYFDFKFSSGHSSKRYYIKDYQLEFIHA